jgi:sec-independent protein translocase protein TatB
MFDIGWTKLLLIALVALIAIGPKELPAVLRNVGHWMGKIRRMAAEFQSQFQEAMREAEMEDLKKHADDLNNAVPSLTKKFDSAGYPSKLDTPSDTAPVSPATVPETPPEAVPAGRAAAEETTAKPPADALPAADR